jgi:molybdenum cofactor biosynthesis enzyme MoaA
VLGGIEPPLRLSRLKIDTVVIRGVNDDELVALSSSAAALGAEVRFIEYMDVGGATHWSMARVVPRQEMLERWRCATAPSRRCGGATSAPADRYRLPDGTVFGIISSTTQPFCRDCDRSRLTADGLWYLCLYAPQGTDLRQRLRSGADDAAIADTIGRAWEAPRRFGRSGPRDPHLAIGAPSSGSHQPRHRLRPGRSPPAIGARSSRSSGSAAIQSPRLRFLHMHTRGG